MRAPKSKRASSERRIARSVGGDIFNSLFLVLFGAFMFLPMLYTINNAFKPLDELFLYPPRIFVQNPTLDNFLNLGMLMSNSLVPISRYLFNTLFITLTATVGQVIVASMAAYSLAKRKFPGGNAYFKLIVNTLMFSAPVTAIPSFIIMTKLGLLDTHAALILPAIGSSLGLYLMKQFMSSIPNSLLEAARIDGANEWYIFWNIVMPNVRPAWLTLIIFCFQNLWGATGGDYLYSEELKTLPYALNQIVAGGLARAGAGAAVSVYMMIVPVGVFIVTQSNIIETMTSSGIKE